MMAVFSPRMRHEARTTSWMNLPFWIVVQTRTFCVSVAGHEVAGECSRKVLSSGDIPFRFCHHERSEGSALVCRATMAIPASLLTLE